MLSLQQVSFCYEKEEPVIRRFSADFYEGCVHAVAGPSGCGKSTLFQIINGVIPHVNEGELTGTVLYKGQAIEDVPPSKRFRDIGLVMQDPDSQFCTFTVEDELAFGLENQFCDADEIRRKIADILPVIGMEGREKDNLAALSGGEKQKIAAASLLIMEPRILILDEPAANLDPESRSKILDLILDTAAAKKITVIMTEHHLDGILSRVDRILLMNSSGEAVMQGTRGDVLKELEHMPGSYLRQLPPALWKKEPARPHRHSGPPAKEREELLVLEHVSYAYPQAASGRRRKKGLPVLKDVSLKIRRGDFAAVAGRNGAGKSTLFKLIFGIAEPDGGSVRLEGREIRTYDKQQLYRKMGLVFQNPESQFITNQVDEEMMFSLRKAPFSEEEKREKVHRMLERFSLLSCAQKSPFAISQGQKRRLSVATMLLTDQEILFLDEPTYGQDYANRQELMDDMMKFNEQGITIVMITHDTDLIAGYTDRVLLLNEGRIAFDGSPEAYLKRTGGVL